MMALSDKQKRTIKDYFESNYNLYFGVPCDSSGEKKLSPNQHIMLLQHFQLHLMELPQEPLERELLNFMIDDEPVEKMITDFLSEDFSPMKPDIYPKVTGFLEDSDKDSQPSLLEIKAYLIEAIGLVAQYTGHAYMKTKDDPKPKPESPSILKWGFFGAAVASIAFLASSSSEAPDISNGL